ncbi:MAG: lipoyl(octanoyl) transferase LipB, partial [Bacteroidia bacterium]
MNFVVNRIGTVAYKDGLDIQNTTHRKVAQGDSDTILLCEHHHVYTFGKSAKKDNLLIAPDFLKQIQAEVHQTDRGGDITYHGPGQLVGYPIINLRKHGIGVKKYIDTLETALINTLREYNIEAYQIDGLTGIWV